MKTTRFFKQLFLFSAAAAVFTGCSKDEEPLNDLAGITSFSFTDEIVKNYTFEIDHTANTIENKDSLPFEFNASNLTADFALVQGARVSVNGVAQESGVTRNDFSTPLTYSVTAEDGVTTRNYKVKVNVAQLDPEGVRWNQVSPNGFSADYATQEYFFLNGTHYMLLGKPKLEEAALYSSADGSSWTEVEVSGDFPVGSNHSVVVHNNKAYVVGFLEMTDPYGLGMPQYYQQTIGEDLYTTEDGSIWTKTEKVLVEGVGFSKTYKGRINTPAFSQNGNIYAVSGNSSVFGSFTGVKNEGSLYYSPAGIISNTLVSSNGTDFTPSAAHTGEMPPRIHAAGFSYNGKMYLAGGIGLDGKLLSDVWSSADGVSWTQVSDAGFSARHKASAVVYDEKLWLFGGLLADGSSTSEILVSEDAGATWTAVGEEAALPSTFKARSNAAVSVDSEGNLWIIGGEYTELSTNEDGDTTIAYKVLTDIWKGKLNKNI